MTTVAHHRLPAWSWAFPLAGLALIGLEHAWPPADQALWADALAAVLVGGAVFAAVHHAETVSVRLGQPFGSLVLAAAVTAIETSLILSVLLSTEANAPEVARDTVLAVLMLVLNGVVGVCLIAGGMRHHEQGFQVRGASGALCVVGTLATLGMILPNFTQSEAGPVYSPVQLVFVSAMSLSLYILFVFVQTVRHRTDFIDSEGQEIYPDEIGNAQAARAAVLLGLALVTVVLLAETLSLPVARAVDAAGLPPAFVGVVIGALTLMPEGLSAVRAARANRLQTSLNLALGSAMASIGLTIPVVGLVAVWLGKPLTMGLDDEHIVLVALTLFAGTLTLATGRTTVLQGGVHMVIFAAFLVIAAIP